ncbi:MAG TPA: MFS transporter [Gemmatirosa sp.]
MTSAASSAASSAARSPSGGRGSALRALRHRDFGLFFGGNLLSNCGTWFQNIALALLVFRLTHSSFWVGAVNFAQFAGVLLLAPWAGSAADRFDRRRLIVTTQVVATAASAALALAVAAGRGSLAVVLGLALLLGLTTAFATPALQAVVPALVPREDLGAAIAMNSVTFNLARAVGPVAGAAVVARFGIPWAIGLNALSFLALAGAVLVVRAATPPAAGKGPRPTLRDSLRRVRGDPKLVALLLTIAAVSISLDPVNTLTPAFATKLFGRPDTFAGVLIGAFGAGAVVASLLPPRDSRGPESQQRSRTVPLALLCFAVGLVGFAVAPRVGFAYVALPVAGFGYLLAQTRATTELQLGVDDEERGRIMALWSVAFLGTRPLASLADGGLGNLVGPRMAALIFAGPALVAGGGLLGGGGRSASSGEADPSRRIRRRR